MTAFRTRTQVEGAQLRRHRQVETKPQKSEVCKWRRNKRSRQQPGKGSVGDERCRVASKRILLNMRTTQKVTSK